ncbi:hypothetical protein [Flagellimonas iocasae]|uniref:Pentapeptide repeat-containing protein n=1 Tax=Flagellimonas iocasae TaxID=2055905 RepID=A0ABW4XUV1_9FLAO
MEKKVIRFAKFNCRSLFKIARDQVRHISYSSDSDFLLVHLTDGNKNLFGFYNFKSPKFYPLIGEYSRIFELISFLSESDIAYRIDEVKKSYESYLDSEEHKREVFYLNKINIEVDNFLPTQNWHLFDENETHYTHVVSYIKEQYTEILKDTATEEIELWTTELGFSNTYQLVEVNFYEKRGGRNNRFYLLFDFNWSDPYNFRSFLIDGGSDIIHDIWVNQENADDKDFLIDTNAKVRDYVLFFCWAVEGDEGHFVLPTKDEMPWVKVPENNPGIDFYRDLIKSGKIVKKEGFDANKIILKNISVIYGTALFIAAFEINTENGTIQMTDDEPVAADMPFEIPFFKRLIPVGDEEFQKILEDIKKKGPDKGEVAGSSNESEKDKETAEIDSWKDKAIELKAGLEKQDCLTEREALNILENTKSLTKVCVKEKIFINDFIRLSKTASIMDCIFEEEVYFVGDEFSGKIEFINCLFKKTVQSGGSQINGAIHFYNCFFSNTSIENHKAISFDFHNFKSYSDVLFDKCHFYGAVIMANMEITGNVTFAGCTFSTTKNLEQLKVYSVVDLETFSSEGSKKLEDQQLEENANLYPFSELRISNSRIGGDLNVRGSTPHDASESGGLLCSFFGGDFLINGTTVGGTFSLYHTFINSGLFVIDSTFKQSVLFNKIEWGYNPVLSSYSWCAVAPQLKVVESVQFHNCTVEGSLNMQFLELKGELSLYGTYIDVFLDVFGVRCKSIDLRFSEIKGGMYCYRNGSLDMFRRVPLLVEEDILFDSARVNFLRLEGIDVKGSIRAYSGTFNHIKIGMGWGPSENGEFKLQPSLSKVGCIEFQSISVESNINFHGINVKYRKSTEKELMEYRGVSITSSTINGDITFFDIKTIEDLISLQKDICEGDVNRGEIETSNVLKYFVSLDDNFINQETKKVNYQVWFAEKLARMTSEIEERLEMLSVTVRGVVLKNIRMSRGGNYIKGTIKLDNSVINRHLDISGFHNIANISKDDFTSRFDKKSFNIKGLNTWCNLLSMVGVQVNGSVFASGLKITEIIQNQKSNPHEAKESKQTEADITVVKSASNIEKGFMASGSNIKGGLYLVADSDLQFVGLDSNNVEYIAVIDGNFDVSVSEIRELSFTKENFTTSSSIINIERTTLDKFRVIDPTPQGINLTGIKVNQWDFGNSGMDGNEKADDYLNVLNEMSPFDKQVYIEIEKSFRNRSEDKEANKIYISMREKERDENKTSWNSLDKGMDSFYKSITEYGTNFRRLLYLWIGLVVVLASLLFGFGALKNVSGQSLGLWESLLYAFKSCIPLFELEVVNTVEIKSIGWKYVIFACTILSYIMLSVALFGYSTKVSRTK